MNDARTVMYFCNYRNRKCFVTVRRRQPYRLNGRDADRVCGVRQHVRLRRDLPMHGRLYDGPNTRDTAVCDVV